MKVSTDTEKINTLLGRGVEKVFPNKEFLEKKLLSGEKLTVYFGIDPTGPTLHLGHMINLLKAQQFQELGHKIILLIGGFTAMIGDPSEKDTTRPQLTHKEVQENASLYKKQASTFLNFEGENKAELKNNYTWLGVMELPDFFKIASTTTVEQLIKRDMFQKRLGDQRPIFVHEFLYPLFQGYDSVAMQVDGEIGGNDQTFNMLIGRDMEKQIIEKEKFVLAMKLLVDPSGTKMGKSEGNMVALNDSPQEMYGKVMSWSDEMIVPAYELCTRLPQKKINEAQKNLESGTNPKKVKMDLARTIIAMYYGEEEARRAEEEFENVFSEGGVPEDIKEIEVKKGDVLMEAVVESGHVPSKAQYRRLVEQGAVRNMETGEKIKEDTYAVEQGLVLRIGKRQFVKIVVR